MRLKTILGLLKDFRQTSIFQIKKSSASIKDIIKFLFPSTVVVLSTGLYEDEYLNIAFFEIFSPVARVYHVNSQPRLAIHTVKYA